MLARALTRPTRPLSCSSIAVHPAADSGDSTPFGIFDAATGSDWQGDPLDRALDGLSARGLRRRARTISGPQGPRVLLDGRPVLLLCSDNYLGLADHPRVRKAAAEAAMRYGAGAGAPRAGSGGMRVHRRLESSLADFTRGGSSLLFGSGYLAAASAVGVLTEPGELVLSDGPGRAGAIDGAKLADAEWAECRRGDLEQLEWTLRRSEGRAGLIVTEGIAADDGSPASLREIVELARRHDARLIVDETHALGTTGPGGRGTVADAGIEHDVDATVGSLGKALGSQGGYVCCDERLRKLLVSTARSQLFSTAPAPPSSAAALAALELLAEQPRRVEKLQRNGGVLCDALGREGIAAPDAEIRHIVSLSVGPATDALDAAERALEGGVFIEATRPPAVAESGCALRLTVMSSHTKAELRDSARALARALPEHVRRAVTWSRAQDGDGAQPFDGLADAA